MKTGIAFLSGGARFGLYVAGANSLAIAVAALAWRIEFSRG